MNISKKQFEKIKYLMPIERKPAKISNQQFLNTLLSLIEEELQKQKIMTFKMKF